MQSIYPRFLLFLLCLSCFTNCKKKELPTINTTDVTQITTNSAKGGGEIGDDGNAEVTSRGLVWSKAHDPTLSSNDGSVTSGSGTGTFNADLTGLLSNTKYFAKAFATNSEGTAYGNEVAFTTNQINLASVTTTAISSVTSSSAVTGGNITSDGGGSVTARGVCWSTSSNPTLSHNKTTDGAGEGSFSSNISGLVPNTTYYVKAYVTNNAGTAYGEELNFTTKHERCIPAIVSPVNNAVMDNGCILGIVENAYWSFYWNSCAGATKYNLYVANSAVTNPALDVETTVSEYRNHNAGIIPDANRTGWTWKVRAYINGEWGDWSDSRAFEVEPINTDCPPSTAKVLINPFISIDNNGAEYNMLGTKTDRVAFIQAKLYEDWVNTIPYTIDPLWVCGHYADQLTFNCHDWGEEIRLRDLYFNYYDDRLFNWYRGRNIDSIKINNGTLVDMGKYGIPMGTVTLVDTSHSRKGQEYDEWYWKGIKSGKGYFGHAMTWVVTGNDLTNWSDITFIEPQTDMVEVPIGYWNIPMNCDEVAFNYYFVHIENGKRYLRWTNLVKFRIENGVPILKSVNNDPEYIIITKRER